MYPLIYFVLGILFVDIILPILENLAVIIKVKVDEVKAKNNIKIAQYENQLAEMQKQKKKPIGFKVESEEENTQE